MRDFVSPITTHSYVEELERRVVALERLVAAIEVSSVEQAAKPKTDRKEYMRQFMAEKRRKEREIVAR